MTPWCYAYVVEEFKAALVAHWHNYPRVLLKVIAITEVIKTCTKGIGPPPPIPAMADHLIGFGFPSLTPKFPNTPQLRV